MSKRCGVFPSYHTDLGGRCVRYIACAASDHTKDPKCPAKGQK